MTDGNIYDISLDMPSVKDSYLELGITIGDHIASGYDYVTRDKTLDIPPDMSLDYDTLLELEMNADDNITLVFEHETVDKPFDATSLMPFAKDRLLEFERYLENLIAPTFENLADGKMLGFYQYASSDEYLRSEDRIDLGDHMIWSLECKIDSKLFDIYLSMPIDNDTPLEL